MTVKYNARGAIIFLIFLNRWCEPALGFYWATNTTTTAPAQLDEIDKLPSEADQGNTYMQE